jgi:hypothetical protein
MNEGAATEVMNLKTQLGRNGGTALFERSRNMHYGKRLTALALLLFAQAGLSEFIHGRMGKISKLGMIQIDGRGY